MTNLLNSDLAAQLDLSWRADPLPDPTTLSSDQRIGWIDRYRLTKQSGVQLSIDEMRHCLNILSASRVEVARRKASASKEAKVAMVAPSLDDL